MHMPSAIQRPVARTLAKAAIAFALALPLSESAFANDNMKAPPLPRDTARSMRNIELGDEQMRKGKPEQAKIFYLRAIANDSLSPLAHNKLGNAYSKLCRCDSAATEYTKEIGMRESAPIVKSAKEDAESLSQLARAFDCLGKAHFCNNDYKAAIKEYDIAAEIYNRAFKKAKEAKWEEKIKEIRIACASVYNDMGVAYSFRKKHKKAIECYQKTLMLSKNFAMAYCNLGKEYSEKGKASEAIRHYSAAIGIAGPIDSADNSYRARLLSTACNNRGYEHFKNKDYTQADMDFRDALRLDPNYAVALANRGLNYIEMSRTEGNRKKAMGFLNAAKKLIDKAIEIDPFFATAYLARHELYRELGMKKEAASEYAAYKKIRREGKRAPNTACYAEGATEERKTK